MYEKAQRINALYAPKPAQETAAKAKRERDLRASAIRGRLSGIKRRATGLPDNQPSAKRPTTRSAARAETNDDEDVETPDITTLSEEPVNAPARHIMGLLPAALDNDGATESAAATPRVSPDLDEEDKADDSSAVALDPRQRSPDPPKGLSEFDQYGTALVHRGPKANNRFAVKPPFQFDDIDIGFRDSTNDSTKIKNAAARGKYLDKPNTNAFYYDPLLWNYDARCQTEEDMDEDLVAKHRVHPRYGFFVQGSLNEEEEPAPRNERPMSVVFITPSGKTLTSSRSQITVATARSAADYEIGKSLRSAMSEFIKQNPEHEIPEPSVVAEKDIPEKYSGPSLGLIQLEEGDETRSSAAEETDREVTPEPATTEVEGGAERPNMLSSLVSAAILASAEDAAARSARAKSASRPYDAIRDVFGTSAPSQPQPEQQPFSLSLLAEACHWEPRPAGVETGPQPPKLQTVPEPTVLPPPRQMEPVESSLPQPSFEEPAYPPPGRATRSSHQPLYDTARYDGARHDQQPLQTGPMGHVDLDANKHPMAVHHGQEEESLIDPRLRAHLTQPPANPQSIYEQPPIPSHQSPLPYGAPPPMMSMHNTVMASVPPSQPQPPPMAGPIPGPHPTPTEHHYGGVPPPRQGQQHQPPYAAPSPQPLRPSVTTRLPPLRPPRQVGHPPPFYANPPPMSHPGMVSTNTGSFYPPGPARPFHTSFPPQEQQHNAMGMPGDTLSMQPYYGPPATSPPSYAPAQPAYQPLAQAPPPPRGNSPPASSPRSRPSFQGPPPPPGQSQQPQQQQNSKYRKLEPAPIPPHRMGWNSEPQLRTVGYNPTEDIKDYSAVEPLPGRGPTFIRGWNVNNSAKKQRVRSGRDDKDASG